MKLFTYANLNATIEWKCLDMRTVHIQWTGCWIGIYLYEHFRSMNFSLDSKSDNVTSFNNLTSHDTSFSRSVRQRLFLSSINFDREELFALNSLIRAICVLLMRNFFLLAFRPRLRPRRFSIFFSIFDTPTPTPFER